jgi:hypothetical protein
VRSPAARRPQPRGADSPTVPAWVRRHRIPGLPSSVRSRPAGTGTARGSEDVDRQPIGYMLLKIRADSSVGPIPAWTQDRTDAFPVFSDAASVGKLAAMLNGTTPVDAHAEEALEAYRATHQPGDRYLVGAVIPWQ